MMQIIDEAGDAKKMLTEINNRPYNFPGHKPLGS